MAVVFENFSYAYPQSGVVLDKVSLDIPRGSFTVITGPSGAGKTTLALAVAGVVPHYFGGRQGGSVKVSGTNTDKTSMGELAAQVGTVLADYESQLVAMTVAEEVAFGLETSGLNRQEIIRKVSQALSKVGLAGLEDREVAGLSGGQKQRLAIASVLVMSPDIIVLDEPASALDPEGAAGIYQLLHELNRQGKTIIVVEHQLARILPYATRAVVMDNGQLTFSGTLAETLGYMWQQPGLKQGVPRLWAIKFKLEQEMGLKLGIWQSEAQAAAELRSIIKTSVKGVGKSA